MQALSPPRHYCSPIKKSTVGTVYYAKDEAVSFEFVDDITPCERPNKRSSAALYYFAFCFQNICKDLI